MKDHICFNCGDSDEIGDEHIRRGNRHYCTDCLPYINLNDQKKHKRLFNPDTNIRWKTFGKSNVYYGLELEMIYPEDIETKIIEIPEKYLSGRYIWKYEGSLNEYGGELVLAPQTFKILHGHKFAVMLQNLIKDGAESADDYGCGLHIHINREAIEEHHLSGFKMFFTYNKEFLQAFSRRYDDEWCYIPDSMADWAGHDRGTKGIAINDCGTHTIEFRLFAGTLDRKEILSAIQLIDSLRQFLPTIRRDSDYSIRNLYRFIRNEPKYQILKNNLREML